MSRRLRLRGALGCSGREEDELMGDAMSRKRTITKERQVKAAEKLRLEEMATRVRVVALLQWGEMLTSWILQMSARKLQRCVQRCGAEGRVEADLIRSRLQDEDAYGTDEEDQRLDGGSGGRLAPELVFM